MAKHAARGSQGEGADEYRDSRGDARDFDDRMDFEIAGDGEGSLFADAAPASPDASGDERAAEPLDVEAIDEGSALRDDDRRGGRAAQKDDPAAYLGVSPHEVKKSRRTRRILIAVVVVVLVAIAGLAAGVAYVTLTESPAAAPAQSSAADRLALGDGEAVDPGSQAESKTAVPSLVALIGSTQQDALSSIGHGAAVTASRDVEEEGSAVRRIVAVTLADEPVDTRTGSPTVYLALNEEGAIVQASYSVGLSLLGYGSVSFIDAVSSDHVVDAVLGQAGVSVSADAVKLPESPSEYTVLSADGKDKVKESFAFSGETQCNGQACGWTATLSYDYAGSNASGAISDVIRRITVTLTSPAASADVQNSEE